MRRTGLSSFVVALVSVLGTVAWSTAPASGSTTGAYVALGDSYAAGPIIPNQIASAGFCLRSDHNFAHVLAPAVAPSSFRDASCSGATTVNMTQSQSLAVGSNAPQFNRLTSDTTVVTLEIGGNDIGFSSIVKSCASLVPWGSPCKNKYIKNGVDTIATRITATAPKIAAAIDGIHSRSPHARVFVLGYPAILPDSGGGCWPAMPITSGDVPYLRSKHKQLNGMIASQAAAHGAKYVDVYTPSIGHDACSSWSSKWVEPIVPTHLAAPVHPNSRGEQGMANALKSAMGL